MSLPSPGFQTKVSSPAPSRATSFPLPPTTRSLPAEPISWSASSPPLSWSLTEVRGEARGVDGVGARQRVDRERVVRGLRVGDAHRRGEAGHGRGAVAPCDLDRVRAGGAVDDDVIGRAVAGAVRAEVDVHRGDAGSGQIVGDDRVGAAERVDGDVLDAVRVHDDVADVAEEPEPRAVRGQVDVLVRVRAVEDHRVRAVLALDGVAAVARIPDESVVSVAEQRDVAALVPVDRVVSGASDEDVGALAAGDRVVAVAAVDGELLELVAGESTRRRCRCRRAR